MPAWFRWLMTAPILFWSISKNDNSLEYIFEIHQNMQIHIHRIWLVLTWLSIDQSAHCLLSSLIFSCRLYSQTHFFVEMIQSQNLLLWKIWVVLSCLSDFGSYLCSNRRKWHSHPNISLIEVIEANLSNHHCSPGTVFSPWLLIFSHGMILKSWRKVYYCVEKLERL